jgi:hypothetical protein
VVFERLNVAPTDWFEVIVTAQVEDVPLHAPDHPAKTEPELGVAVSVTLVPDVYDDADGLRVTVPDPDPEVVTVSENCGGREKFATADLFVVMLRTHVFDEPLHAPDQPLNSEPLDGVAVSVTLVPGRYRGPAGFAATVPAPVPLVVTATVKVVSNTASAVLFASSLRVQTPEPEQLPSQPTKTEVAEGVAVIETFEFAGKNPPVAELAAGLKARLPLPSPDFDTVSEYRELSVAATVAGGWSGATTSGPIERLSSTAFAASRSVTPTEMEQPEAEPLRSGSERQGEMSTLTLSCCEVVDVIGICSSKSETGAPVVLAYVTRTCTKAVAEDCCEARSVAIRRMTSEDPATGAATRSPQEASVAPAKSARAPRMKGGFIEPPCVRRIRC